jgi:hypothetical protein
MITIEFTDEERNEVEQALYERRSESERYVRSNQDTVRRHDECCETARARKVMHQDLQAELDDRVARVNAALAKVLAAKPKE